MQEEDFESLLVESDTHGYLCEPEHSEEELQCIEEEEAATEKQTLQCIVGAVGSSEMTQSNQTITKSAIKACTVIYETKKRQKCTWISTFCLIQFHKTSFSCLF